MRASLLRLPGTAAPGGAPEWIAFTPDGFYTGSPNVERHFHWRSGDKLLPGTVFPERRDAERVALAFRER